MRLREQPSEIWRWIALLIVLINVAFSNFPEYVISGPTVAEISQQYNSLFTPAIYSFVIWHLICLSFVVYAIYQLLPAQREDRLYDQLAQPFILSNLFAICWVISFRMNIIWLSLFFIVCMLFTALMMYTRVRDAVLRDEYSNWLSVPFSLFAGWLSFATITNASMVLISLGMQGEPINQVVWSTIFILFLGILGAFVWFRCRDFIFPMVISWGCIGIFIAHQAAYPFLGLAALVGSLIPIVWGITTLMKRVAYRNRVWANKLSFSDSFVAKTRGHKLLG